MKLYNDRDFLSSSLIILAKRSDVMSLRAALAKKIPGEAVFQEILRSFNTGWVWGIKKLHLEYLFTKTFYHEAEVIGKPKKENQELRKKYDIKHFDYFLHVRVGDTEYEVCVFESLRNRLALGDKVHLRFKYSRIDGKPRLDLYQPWLETKVSAR